MNPSTTGGNSIGGMAGIPGIPRAVGVERVANGYVVRYNGQTYVCRLLNEMLDMVKEYFEEKKHG